MNDRLHFNEGHKTMQHFNPERDIIHHLLFTIYYGKGGVKVELSQLALQGVWCKI